MATYTIDKRPKHLQDGDRIIFVVGGKKSAYRATRAFAWLVVDGDSDVFASLGISPCEKASMAGRCFGYASPDPDCWPSAKPHDFAAHCRLVNALYDLIEERDGKRSESRPDKGTSEPGIFLGYDWAPADEPLGVGAHMDVNTYETVDEACDAAASEGHGACIVIKLYAVDAKKYTRKFVQED